MVWEWETRQRNVVRYGASTLINGRPPAAYSIRADSPDTRPCPLLMRASLSKALEQIKAEVASNLSPSTLPNINFSILPKFWLFWRAGSATPMKWRALSHSWLRMTRLMWRARRSSAAVGCHLGCDSQWWILTDFWNGKPKFEKSNCWFWLRTDALKHLYLNETTGAIGGNL